MKANTSDKTITYLRHGKSAGNAGMMGVVEMKSLTAYRDGLLVAKGEQQVVDRVASLDAKLAHLITSAEVVLVSPLARALATAVIVLAEAHRRNFDATGRTKATWPRVEVVTELREKVKSHSERPGTGADPLDYVCGIARRYGQNLYDNPAALQSISDDICRSYNLECAVTNGWEHEPEDASSYIEMIRRFKERLGDRKETNILLVGHSGWARFAFAALLPPASQEDDDTIRMNLVNGARGIRKIPNACALTVKFNSSLRLFQDLVIDHDPLHDDSWKCKGDEDEGVGVFCSEPEARAAGAIPDDGEFARIMLLKQSEYTGSWEVRLFTFSSSSGEAHLAWANKWGEPRDAIVISSRNSKLTRLTNSIFVVTSSGHRPFKVQAITPRDSARFFELFTSFRRRGLPGARMCSRSSLGSSMHAQSK
mmetsp:Transcript_108629/g.307074  ORF Transcript_108629/g.307074 Transcript_108629/m.307074 type:complete len:424 (+) Transcript_108629:101-1372(+)